MKFSLDFGTTENYISAYDDGVLRIGERRLRHSVIVLPDALLDWPGAAVASLNIASLEPALERTPDIVVLGTGATQVFPPMRLYAALAARGVGLEVMDTGAACRTFNILVAEDRRVAAALIV